MNSNFNYEEEKRKLEKEKLEWEKIKKEQESRLQRESNILMSLEESILNRKFHNQQKIINNVNNISELESLKLLYENKIKDLLSQMNILQEEQQIFNDYKNNSNSLLNKQKEQIDLKINEQDKRKEEISNIISNLENQEKLFIDEISIFEKEKEKLTKLYNEVIKKQNENKMRASAIDDMVKELDKRKNDIENIKKSFVNKLNEIKIEKEKVDKEKAFLQLEKKNLLLRLESIDKVGMKFIGGKNLEEKEKNWETKREKFFYDTYSGNFFNPLNNSYGASKTGNNDFLKANEYSKTNKFN